MNKVNFDSLKNIKAPEAWLEKAALIPAASAKKRAFAPRYRIAAAASIVLVSVIGLTVFLLFDSGKAPIEIRGGTDASVYPSSQAVSETAAADVPAETMMITATDAEGNTVIRYITATEPTASSVQPTEANTGSTLSAPTQKGTEKPAPTVHPTEKAVKPTEPATEREVQQTEASKETESPPPTASPATEESIGNFPDGMPNISAVATFSSPMFSEEDLDEGVIYCAIYDHGKLVSQGAANVFIMKNGNVFAEYDTGIKAERGKVYHYAFFSKHASGAGYEETPIFASGTISY